MTCVCVSRATRKHTLMSAPPLFVITSKSLVLGIKRVVACGFRVSRWMACVRWLLVWQVYDIMFVRPVLGRWQDGYPRPSAPLMMIGVWALWEGRSLGYPPHHRLSDPRNNGGAAAMRCLMSRVNVLITDHKCPTGARKIITWHELCYQQPTTGIKSAVYVVDGSQMILTAY